jgi:hypothetical protein
LPIQITKIHQTNLVHKVRYNTELEQAQRVLSARVEEASLQARHAALEADMNRCSGAPFRAGPFFWDNFGGPKCWKTHH